MFLRNMIIWIRSENLVWKMNAVSKHQPASTIESGRVLSPISNMTPPPISSAAGRPQEDPGQAQEIEAANAPRPFCSTAQRLLNGAARHNSSAEFSLQLAL